MEAQFDVFLSHNSKDKPTVRQLAEALQRRGLKVWLDEWELVPGQPWQEALEEIIQTTRSAAVLVGKDGLGPWEIPEMRGCLTEFISRKLPVIPVLLPDAPSQPNMPLLLKGFTWIDLRAGGLSDANLDRLEWGITGQKPSSKQPPGPLIETKPRPEYSHKWLIGLVVAVVLAVIFLVIVKPRLFTLAKLQTVVEPRTALVIGNAAYSDNPLANPVNDARDIANALQGVGFTVMLRENLQKRAMEEVISEFSRRLQQQRGVGLFFYSGHGVQINERNYLIPVGATIRSEADVAFESLDVGMVLDYIQRAGNKSNIIILDTCFNNPFGHDFRGILAPGLAPIDASAGTIIAYSTQPGTLALDGSGHNSPYTSALLKVISTRELNIEQMFKQVRIQVAQATDNKQVPWESSSLMGDFYFVTAQAAPPPAEVPPPAPVLPPSPPAVSQPLPKPSSSVKPGQVFRDTLKDGSQGPEMVMIPAGSFLMGSPPNEPERGSNERQHKVDVKAFAIGKYEVTFEEYDRFAEATGREKPADEGWGRGRQPMINVNWYDAVAYAEWLSAQTDQQYRLPTEAEWEYAARAGTQTAYWWGNKIGNNNANCNSCASFRDTSLSRNARTLPVGFFPANPFKLHDTSGNVWEWTCSEYSKDYDGQELICITNPTSEVPRTCRGGVWSYSPRGVRAAYRSKVTPYNRDSTLGFRLAKNL